MDPIGLSKLALEPDAVRILMTVDREAHAATAISMRAGVAIACTYRKLHALEDAGLVASTEGASTRNGKATRLYRSTVKSVRLVMHGRQIVARIELHNGLAVEGAMP